MTEPTRITNGRILIADTRLASLRRMAELVRRAGYEVIEAASFDEAKRRLTTQAPTVLISGLRLGAFNGLHLVHLARLTRPDLHAIIIADSPDVVLQSEAERVAASLLVEPVPPSSLLTLLAQVISDAPALADGLPGLDRRHAERRLTNVSDFAAERRVAERRVPFPVPVLQRDRGRL
jgi:DNA-binding NtrC family response regulator